MTCRGLLLAASLLGGLCVSTFADDPRPPSEDAALVVVKSADQLYQQGKFQDAADKYQVALKISTDFELAQLGLSLSLLKAEKTDEALDAVVAARKVHPNSAALMTALGDIQFRRGEMAKAEQAYRSAIDVDKQQAQAYLGLARLYNSFSLYAHAYDNLKKAHEIDPKDPAIQLDWLYTLPKRDRWSALMTYLGAPHPESGKDQKALTEYFQYLQATLDQPPHTCRLTGDVTNTQTKLTRMPGGAGLEVKVNDRRQVLLLDTGASGITISRKAAEKAKLVRISDVSIGGIGDKGDLKGYLALADRILIGNWEFRDCVVTVGDKKITGLDGLIGADVFASYLVDIDFPKGQLSL